jgi:hypothetical protein
VEQETDVDVERTALKVTVIVCSLFPML